MTADHDLSYKTAAEFLPVSMTDKFTLIKNNGINDRPTPTPPFPATHTLSPDARALGVKKLPRFSFFLN